MRTNHSKQTEKKNTRPKTRQDKPRKTAGPTSPRGGRPWCQINNNSRPGPPSPPQPLCGEAVLQKPLGTAGRVKAILHNTPRAARPARWAMSVTMAIDQWQVLTLQTGCRAAFSTVCVRHLLREGVTSMQESTDIWINAWRLISLPFLS